MAKDNFLIIDNFAEGWIKREDEAALPLGACRDAFNMTITDRLGISPRKGEQLLGELSEDTGSVKALASVVNANDESVLVKIYGDETSGTLAYYSNKKEAWHAVKDSYKSFDFDLASGKNDEIDVIYYMYLSNGIDPYQQWAPWDGVLTASLAGGETEIPVDSVFTNEIYETGTSASSTPTSLTLASDAWATDIWNDFYVVIKSGAQSGKVARIVNTEADKLYFSQIPSLTGAVDFEIRSIAIPDTLLYRDVASSATTTTIDIASANWQANQWDNFYVHITSGANAGDFALISATTTTQITFATIAGLSGTPDFEIRTTSDPNSGEVVYNGTAVAYQSVDEENKITVASAHASAGSDDMIAVMPIEYPAQPRGNRFSILYSDLYMAGMPSAPRTVRRSATGNFTDFTNINSPRAANEPNIVGLAEGRGKIRDIAGQESAVYIGSEDNITALSYSQDANDIAQQQRITLGDGAGIVGRFWRMENDIAFVTPDKRVSTIGRELYRDQLPQRYDLADRIRRVVKNYNFEDTVGAEFRNYTYLSCKEGINDTKNNLMLPYKKDARARNGGSWVGRWAVSAGAYTVHNGKMYIGSASSPDVYELNAGLNKQVGEDLYPLTAYWQSGWINMTGSGFYIQEVSRLAVEGYISGATTINFDLYSDFASQPFTTLQIVAKEDEELIDGQTTLSVLGGNAALGLEPLGAFGGTLSEVDEEGRRHFIAYLDFPFQHLEYLSVQVRSDGISQNYEVNRMGLNTTQDVFESMPRIKQ